MALKITLKNAQILLPSSIAPSLTLYVKLGGLNFNAFTGMASIPLTYRYYDGANGPVGDWLLLPLPASAEILFPRQLMMSTTESPFAICYETAAALLQRLCGPDTIIENLL